MDQIGHVFQGRVLTPQEHADAALDSQARRLTVSAEVERRNAQIAAAKQKQEQDAYLQDAFARHQGDVDAVIAEAYTKDPSMAMGLEEQVATHRKKLIDARKVELETEKLGMDADTRILDMINDERTFSVLAPKLSKELQSIIGPSFNPEVVAQLKQKGPTESQRIDKLRLLLDKDLRAAMIEELGAATSQEALDDVWAGYDQVLGPKETAGFKQRLGTQWTPDWSQKMSALLISPEAQMRDKLQRDQMAQSATEAQASRGLRAREIGVAEGNLQQRKKEADAPKTAGSGGTGGAKLTGTAVEKVASVDQSIGMLDDIDRLLPNMAAFIGPMDGRLARAKLATGAGVTPELAEFDAQLTGLKNAVIKATTGAAMSEPEAKRIMGQLPDLNLPEAVFKARLATTRRNLELLKKRTIELSGGSTAPSVPKKMTAEELIKKYGGG